MTKEFNMFKARLGYKKGKINVVRTRRSQLIVMKIPQNSLNWQQLYRIKYKSFKLNFSYILRKRGPVYIYSQVPISIYRLLIYVQVLLWAQKQVSVPDSDVVGSCEPPQVEGTECGFPCWSCLQFRTKVYMTICPKVRQ